MPAPLLVALAAGAVIAATALLALLRRRYVAVEVIGDSMRPALLPGQRVLVRRTSLARLRPGQIIVFAPPAGPRDPHDPPWLVKRLIAGPGDPLPATLPAWVRSPDGRVPSGEFAAIGDNAGHSYDSRVAGLFAAQTLLGVVVRVLPHRG